MDYTELIVNISGDTDSGRDITVAELAGMGFESFEETANGVKAYIRNDKFDEKIIYSLIVLNNSEFKGSGTSFSRIETVNWNQEWENNYDPVSVGDFCHIRAAFHNSSENFKHEIIIQPKMSFGTGHHETTWLMINAMQNTVFSGKEVLDMGCGTGVLAILASKMGARHVTAIDIDDWSVQNANENATVNEISNIIIIHGDIGALDPSTKYDIILANITRNVLAEYIPSFSVRMADGGHLFTSGFYLEDLDAIRDYAAKAGLSYISADTGNRWTMALFKK